MTVRLGLVGCGRIAGKHIRSMAAASGIALTAVSDLDAERMDRLIEEYRFMRPDAVPIAKFTDYRELIQSADVDAVVVATVSGLHAAIALEAVKAGKPVMVEKPVALNLRDADRLIAEAEARRVPVLVCHQLRYRPLFRTLKWLIEEGEFGDILYGAAALRIRRDPGYYAAAAWRGSWEHDGGMLVNQGIHLLDLLIWLLGDAATVDGHVFRIPDPHKETEDAAIARIRFAGGAVATIDANTITHPRNLEQSLSLFGERSTAAIGGEAFHELKRWHAPCVTQEEAERLFADRNEHLYMYQDFIHSIKNGKTPLIDAKEGKKALEAIFAIYQSHLRGQTVRLPIVPGFSPSSFKNHEGWCG